MARAARPRLPPQAAPEQFVPAIFAFSQKSKKTKRGRAARAIGIFGAKHLRACCFLKRHFGGTVCRKFSHCINFARSPFFRATNIEKTMQITAVTSAAHELHKNCVDTAVLNSRIGTKCAAWPLPTAPRKQNEPQSLHRANGATRAKTAAKKGNTAKHAKKAFVKNQCRVSSVKHSQKRPANDGIKPAANK